MEEQVTRVLEANLAATEGVISMESRASEGRTNVNLIFDYGTDIDLALQDASRNLDLARTQLPPDIDPPRIYKVDPSQAPIFEVGFTSQTRSEMEVRDWLESHLATQLLTVRGVGSVEVAGGQVREIQVILDQERLDGYGIPLTHIEAVLAAENIDLAAGQVTSPSFDVMAKTDGRFRSVQDIEDVVLIIPGTSHYIRLREVATVRDTHREQRIFVRLNGEPATRLSVMKLPDANTVAVIDGLRQEIERLRQSGYIPADIDHEVTRDQSFFINNSIGAVSTAALLGGLLAMLIVLLFLGSLRKAFIIGLSIPLAILATFAMMGASGLTLNIMSLGGLALGVGLLLDNSIVMLENIFRHREEYDKEPGAAALDGSKEVTSAVLASTLTNLAAVSPFLLITGLAAMVFRDLILTISFAIVASLAVSLTLVPMLAALLGRVRFKSGLESSILIRAVDHLITQLTRFYVHVAAGVFRWRWLTIAITAGLVYAGIELLDELGNEFLPEVDDGNVSVRMHLPPGAPPLVTYDYALQIEEAIAQMPHVESVFALVGGHLGGGILNERPGTARFSIQLTPASTRPDQSAGEWVREMQDRLDTLEIAGARLSAQPPSIPGIRIGATGSAVSIGLVGEDIVRLDQIGRQLLLELEGIPGLTGLELSRDDRSPLLHIDVDRTRAADLDLNVSDIARAVRAAVHGSVPTRFSAGVTDYDIRLMLPRDQVSQTDDLNNLILFRNDAQSVRLGDVASFTLGDGPAHIERENQARIVRLD
ncbi:MAG: efflux RND transporter permease subunit, partial [Bradymonadaceae bacterium]